MKEIFTAPFDHVSKFAPVFSVLPERFEVMDCSEFGARLPGGLVEVFDGFFVVEIELTEDVTIVLGCFGGHFQVECVVFWCWFCGLGDGF